MELIPIVEVETALELEILIEVLKDRQLPCRVEPKSSAMGSVLGHGAAAFEGVARIWSTEEYREQIIQALDEVHNSEVADDKSYLVNGRMWRIKKK